MSEKTLTKPEEATEADTSAPGATYNGNPFPTREEAATVSMDDLCGLMMMLVKVFPDPKTRIAPRTALQLKSKGLLPFVKVGGRTFYIPSEVRAAFERNGKINAVAV